MTSQLARELAALQDRPISAREAMEAIEASTASPMEKSHARSILMESNSLLQGTVRPDYLANRLEDKVEFWRDMGRSQYSAQIPRWRR